MTTGTILDRIVASTRARIAADPPHVTEADAVESAPPPSFATALASPGLSVIAEIKRRSPSAGPIAPDVTVVEQADSYVTGGAAAISVLTEPEFFGGSIEDLAIVAGHVDIPVLRKDFIIDGRQVWEARRAGAAAVLLIVAALDTSSLSTLLDDARRAGLDALVEVHTPEEARRALDAGAAIVGVNNRDLATFETDLRVAESIAPLLDGVVTVAESGVSQPDDARRMAEAGYDAILVGEALMRSGSPAGAVERLRKAHP